MRASRVQDARWGVAESRSEFLVEGLIHCPLIVGYVKPDTLVRMAAYECCGSCQDCRCGQSKLDHGLEI